MLEEKAYFGRAVTAGEDADSERGGALLAVGAPGLANSGMAGEVHLLRLDTAGAILALAVAPPPPGLGSSTQFGAALAWLPTGTQTTRRSSSSVRHPLPTAAPL